MLGVCERNVLQKIFGDKKVEGIWQRRTNVELYNLYNDRMDKNRSPFKLLESHIGRRKRHFKQTLIQFNYETFFIIQAQVESALCVA